MKTKWNVYRKLSGNQSESCFIPNFIDNPLELREEIENILFNLKNYPSENPLLRVFDERGGIRLDLAERLLTHHDDFPSDFDRWFQSVTGLKKYCIALKEITRWSEKLEALFQRDFVKPYCETFGIPLGGFEFYCFIGNYGYTPFGIHYDPEHSLVVNLGPAPKKVWIWPMKVYEEQTGSRRPTYIVDSKRLKGSPYNFVFKAGDFCHLPYNEYHILQSNAYSVMFGIIPYPGSVAKVLSRGADARQRFEQYAEKKLAGALQKMIEGSFAGASKVPVQYMRLLQSNGYITASPVEPVEEISDRDTFKASGHELFTRKLNSSVMEVISRGNFMHLHYCSAVKKLLRKVVKGESFSIGEMKQLLGTELDKSSVDYTIRALVRCGTLIRVRRD